MDRREFLNVLGLGALGSALASKPAFATQGRAGSVDDRIIVFIDLSGGNDGLNMMPPLEQWDELQSYRGDLMLPKNQVIELDSKTGLHPSMPQLAQLYQAGQVAVVQGVSYPTPNMSHFRASEIVWSGSGSTTYKQTGWLGSFLDSSHPDFPDSYPNQNHPDPLSISFSSSPSLATQGVGSNYATVTSNASKLAPFQEDIYSTHALPTGRHGEELDFLRTQMDLTLNYNQNVYDHYQMGPDIDSETEKLSRQLEQVTRLIKSGIQTKVYVVSQGGYDTHGGQVIEGDATLGKHADLLSELDSAIGSFMQSLKDQGLEDRVVGVVTSEFGRRIMSNDSLGTDHGHAAPWVVFGNRVQGGVLGDSSVLPSVVDSGTNVPMQHDYRDIYATILSDWFGMPATGVADQFEHQVQKLNLFDSTVGVKRPELIDEMQIIPSNTSSGAEIQVYSATEVQAQLYILDARGTMVHRDYLNLSPGTNHISLRSGRMPRGQYYVKLVSPIHQQSSPLRVH